MRANETRCSAGDLCANCGQALHGKYCSSCGQKKVSGRLTLGSLVIEALAELLAWFQGRLFRTLALMIRSPGELTCEFLRGRRASYIGPVRLFIVTFGVFFFVLTFNQPSGTSPSVEVPEASDAPLSERLEAVAKHLNELADGASSGEMGLSQSQISAMKRYTAIGALLLVPFLAIILKLTDRRRELHLPEHFVFSLHLHTFGILLSIVLEIVPSIVPLPTDLLAIQLLGSGCYFYMLVAFSRIYPGLSFRMRLLQASAVGILYLVAIMFIGVLITCIAFLL